MHTARSWRRRAACRRRRQKMPRSVAPNSRSQLSRIFSNTGCASATELLITRSTSAVAVCCSSASLVSLNSRTFWMAITAWSAKMRQRYLLVAEVAATRPAGCRCSRSPCLPAAAARSGERQPIARGQPRVSRHVLSAASGRVVDTPPFAHASSEALPASGRAATLALAGDAAVAGAAPARWPCRRVPARLPSTRRRTGAGSCATMARTPAARRRPSR